MTLRILAFVPAVALVALAAPPPSAHAHPSDDAGPGAGKRHHFDYRVFSGGGGGAALGVNVTDITTELREFFGAPSNAGVLVARVGEGTAADKGGVKVGDVIVAVDGQSIDDSWSLIRVISASKPDTEVQVDVVRKGKRNSLSVRLDERKALGPGAGAGPGPGPGPGPGGFGPGFPFHKRMFKDFHFEMPDMPDAHGPHGPHGPQGPHAPPGEMGDRLKKMEERLKKLEQKL